MAYQHELICIDNRDQLAADFFFFFFVCFAGRGIVGQIDNFTVLKSDNPQT